MKLSIFFLSILFTLPAALASEAVFIAHPEVTETEISADDLKAILIGNKMKWSNGKSITLVVWAEGPVHETVVRTHAQRSPDQFDKYWKKLVFSGKGSPPLVGKTEAEVVALVAKTPGAFGYIGASGSADGVKILKQR